MKRLIALILSFALLLSGCAPVQMNAQASKTGEQRGTVLSRRKAE